MCRDTVRGDERGVEGRGEAVRQGRFERSRGEGWENQRYWGMEWYLDREVEEGEEDRGRSYKGVAHSTSFKYIQEQQPPSPCMSRRHPSWRLNGLVFY